MSAETGSKPKLLLGQEEATIDDKGRVLVAKNKRDRLGSDFVMRLGDNGCIYAYPLDVWQPMVEELEAYDETNLGSQIYTRLVLGTAVPDLNFDGQGRVVIPRKLRDTAKLKDRIVLIGCGSRLEIWAEDELERHNADPAGYGKERADLIRDARRQMKGDE